MGIMKPCGRVARRIEQPGRNRDAARKSIESTKVDSWELPETEPQTKEYTRSGLKLPTHIKQIYSLVFMRGPNN